MKLLESTKSEITKSGNGKNVSNLEYTEVVLVYCNIVNNNYQQKSWVLCMFVSNKSFGWLLDIFQKIYIFLEKFIQNFHILKYG